MATRRASGSASSSTPARTPERKERRPDDILLAVSMYSTSHDSRSRCRPSAPPLHPPPAPRRLRHAPHRRRRAAASCRSWCEASRAAGRSRSTWRRQRRSRRTGTPSSSPRGLSRSATAARLVLRRMRRGAMRRSCTWAAGLRLSRIGRRSGGQMRVSLPLRQPGRHAGSSKLQLCSFD